MASLPFMKDYVVLKDGCYMHTWNRYGKHKMVKELYQATRYTLKGARRIATSVNGAIKDIG